MLLNDPRVDKAMNEAVAHLEALNREVTPQSQYDMLEIMYVTYGDTISETERDEKRAILMAKSRVAFHLQNLSA